MRDQVERAETAEALEKYTAQRNWYSRQSSRFKKRAQLFSLLVIICGGLIALLPVFKPTPASHWSDYAGAVLGLIVVISQGVMRIWRWDEIWPEYRKASERMKREQRLYLYNANPYAAFTDEAGARRRYIDALESIIAEEQKLYWQAVEKADQAKS